MPELLQDYVLVLRINPSEGPRQLVFTFCGIVGACGMNEAGIGLNINFLSPRDVGVGRLHSIAVRRITASQNLAEALGPPASPPRAGGAHYLIADDEGNIVSIETTGQRYWTFHPEGNAYGHTNQYLSASLKELEFVRDTSIGSSLARYSALQRSLRENGDSLNLEFLKDLTRNHSSYPRSICAHGSDAEPPGQRGRTLAAMVQVLSDRELHITRGCACENDFEVVSL
jgi:isopenicillin-N N-acyltransferase-like protein